MDELPVVGVISTGLFAGAAAAVSLGEHPARMRTSMQEARKHFNHSYDRVAPFQVILLTNTMFIEPSCFCYFQCLLDTSTQQGVVTRRTSRDIC